MLEGKRRKKGGKTILVLWKLAQAYNNLRCVCLENRWTLWRTVGDSGVLTRGWYHFSTPPALSLWWFCPGKTEPEDQQVAVGHSIWSDGRYQRPIALSTEVMIALLCKQGHLMALLLWGCKLAGACSFLADQKLHTCIEETREVQAIYSWHSCTQEIKRGSRESKSQDGPENSPNT